MIKAFWGVGVAALFLLIGVVIGYDVRQPSLVAEPAQELVRRLDNVEKLLVSMQIEQPREIATDVATLASAVASASAAVRARATDAPKKIDQVVVQASVLDSNLRKQNIAYDRALGTHIAAVRSARTNLFRQATAVQPFSVTLYDQTKRFFKWIGAISFLTFVALVVFLLLLNIPGFRSFVGRAGTVTAFGLTLDFRDLAAARESLAAQQLAVETGIQTAYQIATGKEQMTATFEKLYAQIAKAFAALDIDLAVVTHRATMFAPGFIGQDLVQVSRYIGRWDGRLGDERKIGRTFSTRFGIIGKAWRLERALYNPEVVNTDDELIRQWGFTKTEAKPFANPVAGATPTASLMAFVIRDAGSNALLGIVYFEADGANRLHDAAHLPDPGDGAACEAYAEAVWSGLSASALEPAKRKLKSLQAVLRSNDKVVLGEGR